MDIDGLKAASDEIDAGDWVKDIPGLPGVSLKVRGLSASSVVRGLGRALRAANDPTPEQQDAIEAAVLVEYALCDWDGFTKSGEPFPFSRDAASEMIGSSLFEAGLRHAAMEATRKSREKLDALAKNSPAPSKPKRSAA